MCISRWPATTAAAASPIASRSIIPAGCRSWRCSISCRPIDYWERMNRLYALKIYHWTFLAQPSPLPETLIGSNPDFFLKQKMASQTKSKDLSAIDPRALEHYLAPFRDPSRLHAMCEDYRAGAYADFEIDKADRDAGKKITIPMLALWGDAGIASAAATPLDTWKNWATNVRGAPVDQRAFSDGGKSGRDGEDVAGVFYAGVNGARRGETSSSPAKAGIQVRCGLSAQSQASLGYCDHPPARMMTAERVARCVAHYLRTLKKSFSSVAASVSPTAE